MPNGYERQFTYVYGAVSPQDGKFDWMLAEKVKQKNSRLSMGFWQKIIGFLAVWHSSALAKNPCNIPAVARVSPLR